MSKLLITKDFQNQIDLLHRLVGNIEWSGVMFYTTTGIFNEKESVITPKYIFPMDVGNSARTDFEYNEVLLDAYDLFPDAENCREGIIHTHHSMSAHHSQTDISELQDNAKNYDWYLSLVVDLKQEYKAKIAIQPTSIKVIVDRPSGKFEVIGTNSAALMFDIDIEYETKPVEDQNDPMVIRINKLIEDRKVIDNKSKDYTQGGAYGRSRTLWNDYNSYDDYDDLRSYGSTPSTNQSKRANSLPVSFHNKRNKKDKKNGRKVPLHYDFLAKWISQDLNSDDLVYTSILNVVTCVEGFSTEDQLDMLEHYGDTLVTSFDEYFEGVYGETLEYYINTIKDLSLVGLIQKYSDAISTQKDNQRFSPIIEVISDALETIKQSILTT